MKLLAPIKNDEDIVNKKYVDSIDIGSRNIVTGTDTMTIGSANQATWKNKQWRQSGTGTIETIDITESIVPSVNKGVKLTASSTEQIGICQDLIPLNNNNIYTLSCWVRGSSSGLTCRLQPFYASSTDTGGVKNFTLTGEWQYISYTANKTPQNTTNYSGSYIYLIPTAAGDTLEVCGIKLERGDKATDWSPAPEDLTTVNIVAENPSENTNTYVPFCKGVSNGSNLLINNGIRYYTREGTEEFDGFGELIVGNNINSGTANNKWGSLRLYGHGTTYEAIRPYEQSEDLIKYLVGSNSATSIGSADTPVYIDNKGIVTSTGKKFSDYLPLTGTATSAVKLDSSAGSATQPVYFSDGKPVSCTYILGKSVPSDAVFTDTKVTSVYKNPLPSDPQTTGYLTWVTNATTGSVSINNGIRYATLEGTDTTNGYGIFILGNNTSSGTDKNKYGAIRLYGTGAYYGQIAQMNGTSNVNHSLPATSGTILNTGTTSFTPSLTSGTPIGTLKINNKSTTLYAPDNYLPLAGGTVTGTLVLSKTTDNSPALIIGNTDSEHLEFDTTNIMVKSPEAIPSVLTLNHDGGDVYIGKRGTGNLIGVCQDVISGTILNEEPGMGTDTLITLPSNRTKAIIEVRYSTSHSQTVYINNLNTVIPPTTLLGSSTTYYVKYSVATNGTITITLINNQPEGSSQRYSIKYMVTYFN